jgi:anaerobic selenocysteine-containing dehydrogenase
MITTHRRACNLCEAICGLEIEVENKQVISIKGDKSDPFSRGHICPKAMGLKDLYEDPDRLKRPIKKTANGWEEISWEAAFDLAAEKIHGIQAKYGSNAVGIYQGNPSVHNFGTMMNSSALIKAIRTQNNFSATSTDQLPHHFAAWLMYGHPSLLPVPDIDHTDYFFIIGGNPMVSNGSIMTSPDFPKRMRAIQARGGKVVVIDPRKTETADKADEHHFIKPGSDAWLLAAMIQVIFEEKLTKNSYDFIDGTQELESLTKGFTPELAAKHTGISASNIRRMAREIAVADRAAVYGRMGASVQAFGGICLWLINAISVITGNLDRQGGMMFTNPALDFLASAKPGNRFGRWKSRVRELPEFIGELPVAVLAEEILTEGEGQIKAMITSCGNPILSNPNGQKLDKAFESLEFMVSIDIFLNETTRHADLILPPASGLEISHFDLTFNTLAIRNTVKYSEPTLAIEDGQKFDWEIFQELTHRLSGAEGACKTESPDVKLNFGLMMGPHKMTLEQLKAKPEGIDLGELKSCLPERLIHTNKRVNLTPELLKNDLKRLFDLEKNTNAFQLISRRELRSNNSWMHNAALMMKGRNRCVLQMNQFDADAMQIKNEQLVRVKSRVGEVQVPVEISDEMMRGVVSLPHGYGHGRAGIKMRVAEKHAGVSINDLTDELQIDQLTGNIAFSNVAVEIFV